MVGHLLGFWEGSGRTRGYGGCPFSPGSRWALPSIDVSSPQLSLISLPGMSSSRMLSLLGPSLHACWLFSPIFRLSVFLLLSGRLTSIFHCFSLFFFVFNSVAYFTFPRALSGSLFLFHSILFWLNDYIILLNFRVILQMQHFSYGSAA